MVTAKLLVREYKRDSGTHVRYLYTTDLSLSEEACLAGDRGVLKDVKAPGLDSPSWRRERLQGYLTVLTINNCLLYTSDAADE